MQVSLQGLRVVQVPKDRAPTLDIYKPWTRQTVGWKYKCVETWSPVQKDENGNSIALSHRKFVMYWRN